MHPLDQHRITRALAGHPFGQNLVFLDETTSTNDHAAALAREGHPGGTVVFAESQSAGRGRRGNTWVAPAGSSLLLSVLVRPPAAGTKLTRLTHLAALAISDAVDATAGITTSVKWPNDLYHGDQKLAGILTEASAAPDGTTHAVIGIGLNVLTTADQLPAELRPTATSVHLASGGDHIPRESLAIALLKELSNHVPASLADNAFATALDQLRRRSYLLGHPVTASCDGTTVTGHAHDLGPEGELLLTLPDGTPHTLTNADLVRRSPHAPQSPPS